MSTYNKITIGGTTVLDLSQDTVADANHIRSGYVGHLNDGTQVTGTYSGSGVDCPTFTAVIGPTSYTVTSITCDKTFAECVAYINNNMFAAIYDDSSQSGGLKGLGLGDGDLQNNIIYYGDADGPLPAIAITYSSNGTITWEYEPVPWKYSSDLTASNLTVTAPSGYYASNASKTLTDSNLTAANIKKDVTIFGVTGNLQTVTATQDSTSKVLTIQ